MSKNHKAFDPLEAAKSGNMAAPRAAQTASVIDAPPVSAAQQEQAAAEAAVVQEELQVEKPVPVRQPKKYVIGTTKSVQLNGSEVYVREGKIVSEEYISLYGATLTKQGVEFKEL